MRRVFCLLLLIGLLFLTTGCVTEQTHKARVSEAYDRGYETGYEEAYHELEKELDTAWTNGYYDGYHDAVAGNPYDPGA